MINWLRLCRESIKELEDLEFNFPGTELAGVEKYIISDAIEELKEVELTGIEGQKAMSSSWQLVLNYNQSLAKKLTIRKVAVILGLIGKIDENDIITYDSWLNKGKYIND